MDGILLAWEGPSSWKSILQEMSVAITTQGDADVWIAVDTTGERSSVQSQLTSAGADMSRVKFVVQPTDTIWIRDYGPRYVYQGDVRVMVDHTYNRPRPSDNVYPSAFASAVGDLRYQIPLVHGGGNYHLNSIGEGFSTELIADENPGLSDAEIVGLWQQYQNVDTELTAALPSFIDATQHIDMWMVVVGERNVIISDFPLDSGSSWDAVCDNQAAQMAAQGWSVTRVPAFSVFGTHYTYTNAVICNDIVLVPQYTNSTVSPSNSTAIAAWQSALPDHTIIPINCQAIVTAAGVMHCIVMHYPAHLGAGGTAPTAYLETQRGGEVYSAGETVQVSWITDDDENAVTGVDLLLSTQNGASFPITIATDLPANGSFSWEVPDLGTSQARLKVVVRDADGESGSTQSPAPFQIVGTPVCAADLDNSGATDVLDLNVLLGSFNQQTSEGDLTGDGVVNVLDLNMLLANFGCGVGG
jgi:agmatine/peptidylarginine deiminase